MSYEVGYDVLFLEPGTEDNVRCPVCKENMKVEKSKLTHTSSIAAMGGEKTKTIKNVFKCLNAEKGWHVQAKELLKLSKSTPSSFLKEEYLKEYKNIVCGQQSTLEKFKDKI